jgi:hypothetical protein
MKTAKQSYRNEFSSISARIDDLLNGTWGQHSATTPRSRKNTHLSGNRASKPTRQPAAPRLWNETLAFTADG